MHFKRAKNIRNYRQAIKMSLDKYKKILGMIERHKFPKNFTLDDIYAMTCPCCNFWQFKLKKTKCPLSEVNYCKGQCCEEWNEFRLYLQGYFNPYKSLYFPNDYCWGKMRKNVKAIIAKLENGLQDPLSTAIRQS